MANHDWLLKPLERSIDDGRVSPFFEWVENIRKPTDFAPAAQQIFWHSLSFPRAIGLMMAGISFEASEVLPVLSKHAFEEADHHILLSRWMIKHGLIGQHSELKGFAPSLETSACINVGYEIALQRDVEKWLVVYNCAIEACSQQLFQVLASQMTSIGCGDKYFDIHVGADEEHKRMGLDFIGDHSPTSLRGRELVDKGLESVALWRRMLDSWVPRRERP